MFSLLSFGYGYEVSLLSFLIGSRLIVRSTCMSSMYSSTHSQWVAAADSQSSSGSLCNSTCPTESVIAAASDFL